MKAQKQASSATTPKRTTVVGVFEDRAKADRAVADLHKAGFRDDQIGVAMKHDIDDFETDLDGEEGSEAGTGAATGALAGLGLGAIAGMGVLAGIIPVIGPAIAAGTLGVILSNAAAGAGIAGLVGALVGAGIPEDEATYYQNEFESGRVVVAVHGLDRVDEAEAILKRYGSYSMDTDGNVLGADTGRSMGMKMEKSPARTETHDSGVDLAHAHDTLAFAGPIHDGDTIEVKEEQLHAQKRPVEKGEVRVRKEIRTETKILEVPVEREEVVIERTPVRKNAADADFREGEEIRIPVREEMVEVVKTPVVTEEVKVGKRTVRDTQKVSGQVRKESVQVDRSGDVDVRTKGSGKGQKPS